MRKENLPEKLQRALSAVMNAKNGTGEGQRER